MKKMILTILVCLISTSVFSNINITHFEADNPNPIKKRAALVAMIKNTVTETQAQMLMDALVGLSLEDLRFISENPIHLDEALMELENRSPDDEDEHGTR